MATAAYAQQNPTTPCCFIEVLDVQTALGSEEESFGRQAPSEAAAIKKRAEADRKNAIPPSSQLSQENHQQSLSIVLIRKMNGTQKVNKYDSL
jgi:hypothetical protein